MSAMWATSCSDEAHFFSCCDVNARGRPHLFLCEVDFASVAAAHTQFSIS